MYPKLVFWESFYILLALFCIFVFGWLSNYMLKGYNLEIKRSSDEASYLIKIRIQ